MFAQQTETDLPSYRPNVLTTFKDSAIADRASLVRNDEKTLVPQYLSALVPSKRAAFTLAEVLITLGIIGVVAAITMPTLISNHQQKVLNTKVKKTYSNIQNAFLAIQNDYGTIGDNSFLFDASSSATNMMQELSTYFNGAKFCKSGTCPETDYTIKRAVERIYYADGTLVSTNFFRAATILLTDGTILSVAEFVKNCDQTSIDTYYDKDGNKIEYENHRTYCAGIHFDVNGSKPPNTFGKDVFSVVIQKNKIVPGTWDQTGGQTLTNILTGKN